jgi:glycosyltransferase involved in cell wall biosynthesis
LYATKNVFSELKNNLKISSIVIAKNEEINIARCIESQIGCIDEIIVLVDETTTDHTGDIVREYPGIKCIITKWKGYAGTKEYAVSLTQNDWVFWIDADEEITPHLKAEILEFKNNIPEHKAYKVARKAFFLGRWIKHSGWYPSRVTRLFNKNSAYFSLKNVHEHLVVNGSTGEFKNDLNHFTDLNINHYFNKFSSYTTLAAEELYLKNRKFKITDITVRPFLLFIKMYFIKRGFMDGIQGFILAVFSSLYVFTKYCKLWEINKSQFKKGENK